MNKKGKLWSSFDLSLIFISVLYLTEPACWNVFMDLESLGEERSLAACLLPYTPGCWRVCRNRGRAGGEPWQADFGGCCCCSGNKLIGVDGELYHGCAVVCSAHVDDVILFALLFTHRASMVWKLSSSMTKFVNRTDKSRTGCNDCWPAGSQGVNVVGEVVSHTHQLSRRFHVRSCVAFWRFGCRSRSCHKQRILLWSSVPW